MKASENSPRVTAFMPSWENEEEEVPLLGSALDEGLEGLAILLLEFDVVTGLNADCVLELKLLGLWEWAELEEGCG